MNKQLWKTTIEVWTEYDPHPYEIDDLAREAMSGDAICTQQKVELLPREACPRLDFFDIGGDDEQVP